MSETKPGTIEVDFELAKELIPVLEDKITGLDNHIVSLEEERDRFARRLAELTARLNGTAATAGPNGTKKRLPKGQGEKIIYDLLNALPPGKGMPIQEIVKRSGVSYSTTFRILAKNKKGYFDNPNGLWMVLRR